MNPSILTKYSVINLDYLEQAMRVLEDEGFHYYIEPFLLTHGVILAVVRDEEAYLVECSDLGNLIRYGSAYLRNHEEKPKHLQDHLGHRQRLKAYAEKVIAETVNELRDAPVGVRNDALFRAAAKLGSFLGWDVLDYQEVFETLINNTSLPVQEAESTIHSGFKRGMKSPRPQPELKPKSFKERQKAKVKSWK
ncbi:MAG: hypothetical protein KC422_02235 [Trueperaceae bacterium]|nr:hypothetical protein [Trueperaceae bacterium]